VYDGKEVKWDIVIPSDHYNNGETMTMIVPRSFVHDFVTRSRGGFWIITYIGD
jgi:hypothetical protein